MDQRERPKKPYMAPSLVSLDANAAKAVLETKADPRDPNARAILKFIGEVQHPASAQAVLLIQSCGVGGRPVLHPLTWSHQLFTVAGPTLARRPASRAALVES